MAADPKTDLAIAGGAITVALIEALVRKGILERGDGLAVLESAQKRCVILKEHGAALVCGNAYTHMRTGGQ